MGSFIRWGIAMTVCVSTALAGNNLLRNGSFEVESGGAIFTEALYWKFLDPDEHGDYWGSASRENWRAVDGDFIGSIRGLWANRGSHGGVWQEIPAETGKRYRFSGWFFSDPEWSARTQEIMIEFWDAPRKIKVAATNQPITDCNIDWTEISVSAATPEGAAWVRAVVNVIDSGAAGSLQFDKLELTIIEADNTEPQTAPPGND